MVRNKRLNKVTVFIGGAVLMLVAGLVIEMGFARPLMNEINAMKAERGRIRTELVRQSALDKEGTALATVFGLEDLAELGRRPEQDALGWLGRTLSDSRLVRLELTSSGAEDFGKVRRSDFTVLARGDFPAMQRFVKRLEEGPRLVTVDAFTIKPLFNTDELEGRFMLSIYDPTGER